MARPARNNAEYFPHFSGLRNHRKVKVLRNKFGAVLGYAFWTMMLEWLIEHDGLEWEDSEIEVEMFASELGVSAAEIQEMVNFCIKLQLLSKTDSGFVYSESLNDYLQPVFDKRQRERERSKDRKRKEDGTFQPGKPLNEGISAAETPQRKEEKRKGKEIDIPDTEEIVFPDKNDSPKNKKFIAPTQAEIADYVKTEYKCSQEAAKNFALLFWSHYESKGWVVGGSKMKKWEAAISGTWKRTREECMEKFPLASSSQKRYYLNGVH